MKKSAFMMAALVCAALFFFKSTFPEASAEMIERAGRIFSGEVDYRSAISGVGESLGVFREEEKAESVYADAPETETVLQSVKVETAAVYTVESGINAGESRQEEPELPTAVAAFLESQEPYADYELPENVSYEYRAYTGDTAVPVAGYNSSGFGYRLHPIKGEVRFHYGTDFAAWSGEDIVSFAAGTVIFAGQSDSYGNYIKIDHGDGWESLYAHCSKLLVDSGDEVEAGQKIALVGETGLATGPHLHFELTKDGVYMNPEYYVN